MSDQEDYSQKAHIRGWDKEAKVWRDILVNEDGKLIIDPSEIFEEDPTDGETGKAATSNWAHDHENNTDLHPDPFTAAMARAAINDIFNEDGDLVKDLRTDRWDGNDTNTLLGVGVCGAGTLSGATDNLALGFLSMYSVTIADYNVALGVRALHYNQAGGRNVCIGFEAGMGVSGDSIADNVIIGYQAGRITTSAEQVIIGFQAGSNPGNFCTCVGYRSGASLGISASRNTFFGRGAGAAVTDHSSNTLIGTDAGLSGNAHYQTCVGRGAGYSATSAQESVVVGSMAMYLNISGHYNTVLGSFAGGGYLSGGGSYSNCVIVGRKAGFAITTGSNNICIGYQAGDLITTGASNIIIGHDIDPSALDATYEINIGGVYKGNINTTEPKFGTRTASADALITGYIAIKDLAGNDRKLAVID